MEEQPKSSTKEETIYTLLRNLHDIKEEYEKTPSHTSLSKKANGMYLTYASLSMIEKESLIGPGFSLIPDSKCENIAGELNTLIAYPDELLEDFQKAGRINKMQLAFTKHMKGLIESYAEGKIKDSDELIACILSTIDCGFGQSSSGFQMVASSTRKICYSHNIAGNLAFRYRELYMQKSIDGKVDRVLE